MLALIKSFFLALHEAFAEEVPVTKLPVNECLALYGLGPAA
jgi:hypothetical protein